VKTPSEMAVTMCATLCLVLLVLLVPSSSAVLARSVLLGAGTGLGSCAAPPYRATKVHWVYGCPPFASCCTELGFCRSQAEWEAGDFRDCNGITNGRPLPDETLKAEAKAGPYQGTPAGAIGPPPFQRGKTQDPEKPKRETPKNPKSNYDGGRKQKSQTYYQQNSKLRQNESLVSENEINDEVLLPQGLQKRIMNEVSEESAKAKERKPKAYPLTLDHLPNNLPVKMHTQEGARHVRHPFTAFVAPGDGVDGSTSNPISIQVHIHEHDSDINSKATQDLMQHLKDFHQQEGNAFSTEKPKPNLKNITIIEKESSKDESEKNRLPRQLLPPHLPHAPLPFNKPIALSNVNQYNGQPSPVFTITHPVPPIRAPIHPPAGDIHPHHSLLDTHPINTLNPHPPVPVLDGKFIHPVTADPHHVDHHRPPLHPQPLVPLLGGYGVQSPHPVITGPHPPLHPHPVPIHGGYGGPTLDPHHSPHHQPTLHPRPPVHEGYGVQPPLQLLPNPHHSPHPVPLPALGPQPLQPIVSELPPHPYGPDHPQHISGNPGSIFSNFPSILTPHNLPPNFIGPVLPGHPPSPGIPFNGPELHPLASILPASEHHPLLPTPHHPVGPTASLPFGNSHGARPTPFVHFGPAQDLPSPLPDHGHSVHGQTPHPVVHTSPHPIVHHSPHPVVHPSPHPIVNPSPHPVVHPSLHPIVHPSPHPTIHLPIPKPDIHHSIPSHPLPHPKPQFHLPLPQPDIIVSTLHHPSPHPNIIHASPHPNLVGSPQPVLLPTPHPNIFDPSLHPGSPQSAHHPVPDHGLPISYLPPLPKQNYYPPEQYYAYAQPYGQPFYAYPAYPYPYYDVSPNYDSYLPPIHSLSNPNIYNPSLYAQPPPQPLPGYDLPPLQHHQFGSPTPLPNIIPDHILGREILPDGFEHVDGQPFGGHLQPIGPTLLPAQGPIFGENLQPIGPNFATAHGHIFGGNLQPIGPTLQPAQGHILAGNLQPIGPSPRPAEVQFFGGNLQALGPTLAPVPEPIFRPPPGLALVRSPTLTPTQFLSFDSVPLGRAGKRSRRKLEDGNYFPTYEDSNLNQTSENSRVESLLNTKLPKLSNAAIGNILRNITLTTKQPIVKSLPRQPTTYFLNAKSNNYLKNISNVFQARSGKFKKKNGYLGKKSTAIEKRRSKKEFTGKSIPKIQYRSKIEIISNTLKPISTTNKIINVTDLPRNEETSTSSSTGQKETSKGSEELGRIIPTEILERRTTTATVKPKFKRQPQPLTVDRLRSMIQAKHIKHKTTTPTSVVTTPFVHFGPSLNHKPPKLHNPYPIPVPTIAPHLEETTMNKDISEETRTSRETFTETSTNRDPFEEASTKINKLEGTSTNRDTLEETSTVRDPLDNQETEIRILHQTIEELNQEIAKIMGGIGEYKKGLKDEEGSTSMENNLHKDEIKIDMKVSTNKQMLKHVNPRLPRKISSSGKTIDISTFKPSETTSKDSEDTLSTQTEYPERTISDTTTATPKESLMIKGKAKDVKKVRNKNNDQKIRIKVGKKKPKIEPYEYPLIGEPYDFPTTSKMHPSFENFVTPVPQSATTTVVYAIPLVTEGMIKEATENDIVEDQDKS